MQIKTNSPRLLPLISPIRSASEQKLKTIRRKKSSTFLSPKSDIKDYRSQVLNLSPVLNERLEFFDSYKSIPKDNQKHWRPEPTARQAYLEDLHKSQLQPKPFGMTSNKSEEKIDLRGFSIGDTYAHAFSEGLKHFKSLESLNLRSNRLSEKGAFQILSNLHYHPVRYLSLSDNILGEKSFECILSILRSPKPYLKHLNLDNTRICCSTVTALASVLCTNQSLSNLSLAKNNLMSNSCKALKEMLHYNEKLKKLDLHWNCIKSEGAVMIFEGLRDNRVLEELDVSWNAIGATHDPENVLRICSVLSCQTTLKHLDMSYNYINFYESELLAKALEANHSLIGLHVAGNDCELSPQGFIIPKKQNYLEHGHFINRIIDSPKSTHRTKVNCWLCEGWKEVEFIWKQETPDPVFLHLHIDGYVPELMQKAENGFFMRRAVPSGEIKFFFSVRTDPVLSKDFRVVTLPEPLELDIEYWNGLSVATRLLVVNCANVKSDLRMYSEIVSVKPREKFAKYVPPTRELTRIQWNLGISLFKEYNFVNKHTLDKCFEFDWNLSKITNLVKNPAQQSQLFEFLQESYESILLTYKHLSAYSGNEVFSVNNYVLIDFLNECCVNDSLYSTEDLGVNWNSVLSTRDKSQLYNPGNALIRYQFMEVFVRIANDRYVRNKICGNIVDATRKLFVEQVLPVMSKYKNNQWRHSVYLTEDVDLVYKLHKSILDALYKKFSGRKCLPGQKIFMSIEEFRELCREARLENEKCSTKDIDLAYTLAVSIQIDEVSKKRHMEMNFVEFLEALARVCDKSTPQNPSDPQNPSKSLKLQKAIESSMPSLLKLCPQPLRENFVFPTFEAYKKMMFT